jgi:hypothetical protein
MGGRMKNILNKSFKRVRNPHCEKANISSVQSVCPSVCTREATRERLNRFSLNFVSEIFMKICRAIPNFMIIDGPEVVIINYNSFSCYD